MSPVLTVIAALAAVAALGWALVMRRSATQARQRSEQLCAAKAELERVAARHETILQHAMDGFFMLGDEGRFIDANPAFCRMLGYRRDELLKMKITDVEERTGGLFGATGLKTGLHHFPSTHRHRDGHLIQLESSVVIIRDQNRKVLVGFARDITQRVRAEEALRRSEEQYRNLVETSRDLIWSLDPDGRWRFLNGATREIYGREPDEMIGRSFDEFVAAEERAFHRGGWDALRTNDRELLQFSTTHVRRDGAPVYLTFNGIVKRNRDGAIVEAVGTARDITRRRQVEAELREAHDRFESMKAGMPLGYVVWTLDGRIREWNSTASGIFGYAAEQALGKDFAALVVVDADRAGFAAIAAQARAGERSSTLTLRNRRATDEPITCEWFNTVLRDGDGAPEFIASIIRDVSERERLEEQLRQAQKLESLGVLAGGVAHDFNNLLVGILGNASLAEAQLPPGAAAHTYIRNVAKAAGRATELTRHMLTYAGRAERDVRALDVNELISDVIEISRAALPKRVSLEVRLDEQLPPVAADSGQLQQVIMNLIINGAEACGEQPGAVAVRTFTLELDYERAKYQLPDQSLRPGNYVAMEVRDNGCGMDAATVARIFEPFFTTKFTGRGLGLSAIRGIVKAHQGGIRVVSRPGGGTTFTVVIPATAAAPRPRPPSERDFAIPPGTQILVIDDEADVREVVQAILEQQGVSVLTAADGAEGVGVFKERAAEIDAVLLDLTMPGLSGEAVFRELVAIRRDVRVIVSSGYSERETAARFNGSALAGFVHKPYTATTLVRKIGAALYADGNVSRVSA